ATDSTEPYTVRTYLIEPDAGEVGHPVWHQIVSRISNFIEQVLLHGPLINAAAGPGKFGDLRGSIAGEFDDGKANLAHSRHFRPSRRHASGHGGGTFREMTDGDGRRNAICMLRVVFPAELMHYGADI